MNPQVKYTSLRYPRFPGSGALQTGVATAVVATEALLLTPTLLAFRRLQEPIERHWLRAVLYLSGVDLTVDGLENVDPDGRYVFMSNHQSLFDVPAIVTALPNSIRFLAKRSLFRVPVFGQALRGLGTIAVDRNDRAYTLRQLQEAQRDPRAFSLHFFAEGTRSPDGRLLPFKKGGVTTAMTLGVPVVPLAVCGSRRVYPKGALILRPGPVHVSVGKPIPVGPDTPEERNRVVDLVRREVVRMLAAGGEPVEDASPEAAQEVVRGG